MLFHIMKKACVFNKFFETKFIIIRFFMDGSVIIYHKIFVYGY